jgi:hypothetical protein
MSKMWAQVEWALNSFPQMSKVRFVSRLGTPKAKKGRVL